MQVWVHAQASKDVNRRKYVFFEVDNHIVSVVNVSHNWVRYARLMASHMQMHAKCDSNLVELVYTSMRNMLAFVASLIFFLVALNFSSNLSMNFFFSLLSNYEIVKGAVRSTDWWCFIWGKALFPITLSSGTRTEEHSVAYLITGEKLVITVNPGYTGLYRCLPNLFLKYSLLYGYSPNFW